ncbi:ATP-binding protein [Streptomyces sp. NPDC058471]|uniref:ATP-binding protein n=1 Tax=Streptomyces sp. NPDC058471 TaxID=3346516 RepID=UPI0036581A3B
MAAMTEERATQYREKLTATPQALSGIREKIRSHLGIWGLMHIADEVEFGANELLTNVSQHTGSDECELALVLKDTSLRVSVSDTSTALPKPRAQSLVEVRGRGLTTIAAMAVAWGAEVNSETNGKDVWFELSVMEGELAA